MAMGTDRILERGEKIELLVDKTEQLNQQAFKFVKKVHWLIQSLIYIQHDGRFSDKLMIFIFKCRRNLSGRNYIAIVGN